MGRQFDVLDAALVAWIERQPLFFVATAPDDPAGHLNLSPKGMVGTFRVLGPTSVAYADLVGSGIETVAHLRANGRIVLMFCAFAGPPKILRLHGRGEVVAAGDPAFAPLLARFALPTATVPSLRALIRVEVERIADSCGFGVPRMDLVGDRDQFARAAETRAAKDGPGWKRAYVAAKNAASIDGLPGLDPAAPLPGEGT